MKIICTFILLVFMTLINNNVYAASIWGSLDGSRMSRTLSSSFGDFTNEVFANGGTIGAAASTLTSGYLSGIDVFFYGWAGNANGVLNASEQTALQNYVSTGGTLIAASDIFNLSSINSATSMFGLTHTAVAHGQTVVSPVASHAITAGISSISYNTESTFTMPSGALSLFDNPDGNPFMAVMETSTGWAGGGRILVLGDHNILADYAALADNRLLYTNIANWANTPESAPVPEPATVALLGIGIVGLAGAEVRRRRKKEAVDNN